MDKPYTAIANLLAEIAPPADGTLTRTLLQTDRLKAVLFGFAAGQELSEHTAAAPAILHFLAGEAEVTLAPTRRPPLRAPGSTCRLTCRTALGRRPR